MLAIEDGSIARYLWPLKRILEARVTFGEEHVNRGLQWFEYSMFTKKYHRPAMKIVFPLIATHGSFCIGRKGAIFQHGAPVITLPQGATEDDHVELLGVLNSSVACFWLKQNSQPKGGAADARWARTYEFTCTTLQKLPLPANFPLNHSRVLYSLAKKLAATGPRTVFEGANPTREALGRAQTECERIRALMIAQQEELDWECYRLYGLIDEDLTYAGELPGIKLGDRAFEIVLARAMADGEGAAWFERHGSTPITEIPERWPADYRELVQRRLDVIASNKDIRLLEKPEYKRRWAIEPWKKRAQAALKEWLLDRLEGRALWFDKEGRSRPRSVAQLADEVARDDDFRGVLELWSGRPDAPTADVVQELLSDQAVPFLAAYRYKPSGLEKRAAWEHTWELQRKEDAGELPIDRKTKLPYPPIPVPPRYQPADFAQPAYWQHRGKLDVPKERFILYPDANRETDASPLVGWAGWDHAQQALALAAIMNEREAEGWSDERMVPLIAGLAELQPWVRQWHGEVDPTYGVSLAAVIDEELAARTQRAGKTRDDLAAWRPAASGRGRRRRTTN